MYQSRIRSYASTFVTYLLRSLKENIEEIDAIILYGSVAKSEASPESDIDLFIDTKNRSIQQKIEEISSSFQDGREAALYKTEGITHEINIKVGELRIWKSLHHSIMNSGIVLWGKYKALEKPQEAKHYVLFYWNKVSKNRGSFLNILYGYKIGLKKYKGLIYKLGGSKIGKSCILIPAHQKEKIVPLFKKYQVAVQQKEVWVYE